MGSTVVRMVCTEVRTQDSGVKNADTKEKIVNHYADLSVAWAKSKDDPNYIYSQLSGGTLLKLATVNEEAAKIFEPQAEYMVTITRIQ